MNSDFLWNEKQTQLNRLRDVVKSNCSCGWASLFPPIEPECDVHALLDDARALSGLLLGLNRREVIVESEWDDRPPLQHDGILGVDARD